MNEVSCRGVTIIYFQSGFLVYKFIISELWVRTLIPKQFNILSMFFFFIYNCLGSSSYQNNNAIGVVSFQIPVKYPRYPAILIG